MVADPAESTSASSETQHNRLGDDQESTPPVGTHPEVERQQTSVGFEAYRRDLEQANQELQREVTERGRVETALRAYARRLDHLHTTQIAILSAQSLSDTLDITIRHIKNSLPCLSTTIVIYDFDRGELEVVRSDRPEFQSGRRLPILMSEAIAHLQRGELYFLPDIVDPRYAHPGMQTAVEIGGRSVLMIPMRYREELIGTMTVTTGEIHAFSDEELVIAREIAASLAIAIQHRRWLEAEQEAHEREATLRQVAQSLTADLELDVVLREILAQLQTIVPTTSSSIFLRDAEGARVVASRGTRTDPVAMTQFAAGSSMTLHRLFITGQARVIDDTAEEPDWLELPGGEYIRSWMGIPLTVKGKTIGALTLDHESPYAFDKEDLERATMLASQAAIGIENARLFKAEQAYAAELEKEVRERTRELEALYEISAAASENLDEALLLDFSLSRAMNALGYSAGAIHLFDDKVGELTLARSLGLDRGHIAALKPDTSAGLMLRQQLLNQEATWSELSANMMRETICVGFKSCVVAPLRAHGGALGTLMMMSKKAQSLTPETQALLSAIADQIGLAVESTELRRRARQTAVMAERERIARDLHDVVTQSIYSIILLADAAREMAVNNDTDAVGQNMYSIMHTAQQAMGEMRMLLYDLRSDVLARKGLQAALAERLQTVEQRAGLATELRVEGMEDIPPELEYALYRVALESLNNALRHAAAQSVIVSLRAADKKAVLRVEDDGIGFKVDEAQNGSGMGLSNMSRRVHDVGGSLAIWSEPGVGTRIEFQAPMARGDGQRRPQAPRESKQQEA